MGGTAPLLSTYPLSITEDSEALARSLKERPCVQPITQVCESDTVEISINFFSLQGLLMLDSVEFFDANLTIPSKQTVLTYEYSK